MNERTNSLAASETPGYIPRSESTSRDIEQRRSLYKRTMAAAPGAAAAAAAAAVAAAQLAAARIELRDSVLPLLNMANAGNEATRETTRFMNVHGLNGIADFADMYPDQAKYLVQMHNDNLPRTATRMGLISQNLIQGLIMWVIDRERRQLGLDIADLDAVVIREQQIEYQSYLQMKDNAERIKGAPKFSDDGDFEDWDAAVMNYLAQIMGMWLCGIDYCCREDMGPTYDPVTDAMNDHERLMQQIEHAGPKYNVDNKAAWRILWRLCLGTSAQVWIEQYTQTENATDPCKP